MKLALGLDVQCQGGKFMSIEDSRQGALVLWEPGNFQDDRAKRVGVCFATDLELFTTNQSTSALVAYRSAADQDTATSSIAAALLSCYATARHREGARALLRQHLRSVSFQLP